MEGWTEQTRPAPVFTGVTLEHARTSRSGVWVWLEAPLGQRETQAGLTEDRSLHQQAWRRWTAAVMDCPPVPSVPASPPGAPPSLPTLILFRC